jgi:hypothetical protein
LGAPKGWAQPGGQVGDGNEKATTAQSGRVGRTVFVKTLSTPQIEHQQPSKITKEMTVERVAGVRGRAGTYSELNAAKISLFSNSPYLAPFFYGFQNVFARKYQIACIPTRKNLMRNDSSIKMLWPPHSQRNRKILPCSNSK